MRSDVSRPTERGCTTKCAEGPALLMISGAGGDAGYYAGVAEELDDAFTVITYDRRGNSRSTGRLPDP